MYWRRELMDEAGGERLGGLRLRRAHTWSQVDHTLAVQAFLSLALPSRLDGAGAAQAGDDRDGDRHDDDTEDQRNGQLADRDALGLIIAVVVTTASVTDNTIGIRLLDKVAAHMPSVTHAWVDAGFKQDLAVHGAVLGIDVEVVKRSDRKPGFVPVKKRWIVEQVYGALMLHRRLVREYESRPESSVSRTLWASMANMTRRLTAACTPTWRNS